MELVEFALFTSFAVIFSISMCISPLGLLFFVPLPLQAAIRMTVKDFKTSSPFTF